MRGRVGNGVCVGGSLLSGRGHLSQNGERFLSLKQFTGEVGQGGDSAELERLHSASLVSLGQWLGQRLLRTVDVVVQPLLVGRKLGLGGGENYIVLFLPPLPPPFPPLLLTFIASKRGVDSE